MKIRCIQIHNYRNLSGLEIHLHDTINFIVGENNLGKSNFLDLLNTLFTKRAFEKDDFFDKSKPIEVEFTLMLDECEIGNFDDLINVQCKNKNEITIKASQASSEENLTFKHSRTDEHVSAAKVRNINYVHYDSLRNPITEISFSRLRGAGSFLNYLIKKKMQDKDLKENDLINPNNHFIKLLEEINTTLQKIKSFKDHSITAQFETEIENLLTKLVLLKDVNARGLDKIGYGVHFSMLIALSILEKLVSVSQNKNFEAFDYPNQNPEKKAISLVLGLDEPEIHLHPYMQRALIKYLSRIIENQEADFSAILKEVFDFDKVIGQVIIVTHSPNILLNDYKQIIRFAQAPSLKIFSGNLLSFNSQLEKHLLIRFELIKEVFFSKVVILVEGDLELASFSLFAKTMGYDFDELGISVINVGGKGDIPSVMNLLNHFGITSIGIRDKDDNTQSPTENNFFQTSKRDFEDELVGILDLNIENESALQSIISSHTTNINNEFVQKQQIEKLSKKYNLSTSQNTDLRYSDYTKFDLQTKKLYWLGLFTAKRFKSYLTGRSIGEKLSIEQIPQVYKDLINKAIQLSN